MIPKPKVSQVAKSAKSNPKPKPRSRKTPTYRPQAVCGSCYKTADFCQCRKTPKVGASDPLAAHTSAIRGKVLLEVADWLAGKSKAEEVNGRRKRAAKIAVLAEAVAQDRMLG